MSGHKDLTEEKAKATILRTEVQTDKEAKINDVSKLGDVTNTKSIYR